jgi:hypothetical protein
MVFMPPPMQYINLNRGITAMLIDVNNYTLNLILNFAFMLIICLGIISVIPWRLKSGSNRWTLSLPFLAIGTYIVYEYTMPGNWDIRLDLLVIWPVLLISIVMGVIRGIVVWRYKSKN